MDEDLLLDERVEEEADAVVGPDVLQHHDERRTAETSDGNNQQDE